MEFSGFRLETGAPLDLLSAQATPALVTQRLTIREKSAAEIIRNISIEAAFDFPDAIRFVGSVLQAIDEGELFSTWRSEVPELWNLANGQLITKQGAQLRLLSMFNQWAETNSHLDIIPEAVNYVGLHNVVRTAVDELMLVINKFKAQDEPSLSSLADFQERFWAFVRTHDGWQQLHDSYANGYLDRGAMGFIQPERIQVKLLKLDLTLALTWWSVSFPSSKQVMVGNSTMDLQKFDNGWKIVASHTSIASM